MSRMFRNGQTIANQKDDGRLWSRTPMQKLRSRVDAQVYLGDLINALYIQSENHTLSQEIVELRQKPNMVVGSTAWPVTLRMVLMMRIMEANFGASTLNSSNNPPVPTLERVPPIPAGALDITLTPDQAHQLGQLLPDRATYGDLYSEIYIQTCTKCFKPRLKVKKSNTFALFHDLDEYPKLCNVHLGNVCSACGLETLLEAIWRDWWRDLGNMKWLKHVWDQNCPSWIPTEKKLEKVLNYFGCRDVNDKDEYVKNFKKARKYRQALRDLDPRPDSKALDVAAQLHAHLIKKGYMRNFFDVTIGRPISEFEKVPEFNPGPIILSKIDDLTIPIFSGLFERQHIPKECIVCVEEKYEIDYGILEQWEQDCAGYTGPWMWSMLEYPNSAIQSCDHDFDVCRACTARHISTSLESGDVNQVTCAQCNRVLNYEDIRNLTEPETFERYDKILLRRALSSEPNFRWCLSSTCENGQVYDNVDPSFAAVRCEECGFMMCFTHQQPWHTDITCTEFDNSRLSGDPNYAQTQKCILGTTKGCPECGVRITKGNGCFHMTCRFCNHEFCWECLADWKGVRKSSQAHSVECYFRNSTVHPTGIAGNNLQIALQQAHG
ncbi:uncharacterized protein K441DRAFT_614748 [Cenococcum geophilum 1.58]|uniref:uncharacterized protein n=1 Tax=Cenococcum geophilum 1.58 TaxID=794803 RepID=UPI00358E27D4|nr:hypothetical protein K441DRAFT_614748 [Cenococcum geophilum 1.58]